MSEPLRPPHPFIIVSAPSGGGKNTIIAALLEHFSHLQKAKTYSSRDPRPGEEHAKYYVSRDEFERKIRDNELLEYEEYAGNYYGTPRKELMELLEQGPAITDIDTRGMRSLKAAFAPESVITMFIEPPSIEDLVERIQGRATMPTNELQKRIDRMAAELKDAEQFDVRILNANGKLEEAVEAAIAFLEPKLS